MKYYEKREEAEAVRSRVMDDPRIGNTAVQFEPYNGWVVVVVPKRIACDDLAEFCEVRDGVPRELPQKVKPTPVAASPSEGGSVNAPSGGITKRIWTLADELGGDRSAVMDAAAAEGINKATAATQFSKWRKAKA